MSPSRRLLRALLPLIVFSVVFGGIELILREIDLPFLREARHLGQQVVYSYDAELGWAPQPASESVFAGFRTIMVRNNRLGLRDVEYNPGEGPAILFLGDSLVWGYDVEDSERFTEQLRQKLSGITIVNAGVSGYGTDQEYLLLNRLWNTINPNVVVLIFSVETDHLDNMTNERYDDFYKPYFEATSDGNLRVRGQPVPRSRHWYFINDPLVHYSWVVRVIVSAYVALRYPKVSVPDRTEALILRIRTRVESAGAKFFIGMQRHDDRIEAFLRDQRIPYASFDGAEHYPTKGPHWTPKGHAEVAARLLTLLVEQKAVRFSFAADGVR